MPPTARGGRHYRNSSAGLSPRLELYSEPSAAKMRTAAVEDDDFEHLVAEASCASCLGAYARAYAFNRGRPGAVEGSRSQLDRCPSRASCLGAYARAYAFNREAAPPPRPAALRGLGEAGGRPGAVEGSCAAVDRRSSCRADVGAYPGTRSLGALQREAAPGRMHVHTPSTEKQLRPLVPLLSKPSTVKRIPGSGAGVVFVSSAFSAVPMRVVKNSVESAAWSKTIRLITVVIAYTLDVGGRNHVVTPQHRFDRAAVAVGPLRSTNTSVTTWCRSNTSVSPGTRRSLLLGLVGFPTNNVVNPG